MNDDLEQRGPPLELIESWIDDMWHEAIRGSKEEELEVDNRNHIKEEVVKEEDAGVPDYETDASLCPSVEGSPAMEMEEEERETFQLLEPVKLKQRKSYDGECRFLTPKPNSSFSSQLRRCQVKAVLLEEDGTVMDQTQQNHMVSPKSHGKEVDLGLPFYRTPAFHLAVSGRLEAKTAQLGFIIEYETNDGITKRTMITSDTFDFMRNKPAQKSCHSYRPSACGLMVQQLCK
ncbi:hypothetical protein PROFUN_10572 [Planoprotostelium fungivorum]|uniref:Uncharacterized protein n=1 Tax=Planoprotostelium fungivorum TaxID=1890364 RepID=A0A2P6NCZ5_9EUKA|nr:hypothetical protein PROFUN_10572 [Planoprotostelium fungivorum]